MGWTCIAAIWRVSLQNSTRQQAQEDFDPKYGDNYSEQDWHGEFFMPAGVKAYDVNGNQ